jgi:hypothetical protein
MPTMAGYEFPMANEAVKLFNSHGFVQANWTEKTLSGGFSIIMYLIIYTLESQGQDEAFVLKGKTNEPKNNERGSDVT